MSASSLFGAVFFAALAAATATRLWLASRHVSHVRAHRARVPESFASEIGLDAHQKAADYTCAKTRFAMTEIAFDAAVLLVLTFGGVLQWLHEASAAWLPEGIGRGLTLLVMVGALMTVLETPFGAYRTFAIETRFGFNKMTPALYCLDFARSIALALAFGLPLGAIVLWLMASAGEYWWFYAWLTWIAFNAFMVAIYPTWIAPLFNRFSPMQDPELKERVERLMARCGFKVKGLMVMDGSRRSTHGNAYFTGFGTSKRIVFFDTLLATLDPGEVEAVLAHELGHFKLRHVVKRMAWLALASLALLWALGWIMQQPWFYHGLGVQAPSTAMALILFSIVLPQFTIGLQPLGAALSRRHEFEADRFAAEHASAQNLVSALIKLYRDNAATLTPDPLHSVFYDSHPPAIARIARLKSA
ncbi:MAG TPA: M48 family metallopeptidase [Burkholderiales bacterium]|jgi:STE24 endopeptidase